MLITQKRIEPYAPHLFGTMLSADNFVQNPEYSQSYNRYSYAFNNPLKYIDPSGWNPPVWPWDSEHERRRGVRDVPGGDDNSGGSGGGGGGGGGGTGSGVPGSSGGTNYFASDYNSGSGNYGWSGNGSSGGPGDWGDNSYYHPYVVSSNWSPPVYPRPNPNAINNALNRANFSGGDPPTVEQTINWLFQNTKPGDIITSEEIVKIQPRASNISYFVKDIERTKHGFKINRTMAGSLRIPSEAEVVLQSVNYKQSKEKVIRITTNFKENGWYRYIVNNNAYQKIYDYKGEEKYFGPFSIGDEGFW